MCRLRVLGAEKVSALSDATHYQGSSSPKHAVPKQPTAAFWVAKMQRQRNGGVSRMSRLRQRKEQQGILYAFSRWLTMITRCVSICRIQHRQHQPRRDADELTQL
jgi:hypothetical protein